MILWVYSIKWVFKVSIIQAFVFHLTASVYEKGVF